MIDYGRDRISVVAVSNIRFLARIGNRSRTESTKAKIYARRRSRLLDREDDGQQRTFARKSTDVLERVRSIKISNCSPISSIICDCVDASGGARERERRESD